MKIEIFPHLDVYKRQEKMWILFSFECIWKDAFKAGTLKTEQQTFYKKAKKRKMKEIRKKVEII